jgi:predicted ATPase
LVRGELRMANQLALQLKQAAKQHGSAETLLISDWAYGVVSFWLGRLSAAKVHLERAAAHDPEYLRGLAARYAANPGVTTRLFLSWTLWLLGDPEPAVAIMAEALALAEPAFHAHTRAWTAVQAAVLHQFLGDVGATRKYAQMAIDACNRQRIPHFRAQAVFLKGWALVASGQHETGITEMERALEQLQTLGNRLMLPYFLTLQAEALASKGRTGEALSRIEAALAEIAVSKQSWCYAEIYRVRGAILGRRDDASASAVEADLMTACEIARSQGALAWELRAATTLADLWMRSGRVDEARALLIPLASSLAVDERHSGDLRAARVLLSRLDERGAELFAPPGRGGAQ